MNKEFFDKLLKNKNNKYIYIILIMGVVFMLFSSGNNTDTPPKDNYSKNSYQEEKRLEKIISDINGAGKVSVMITYYGGIEQDLAYETKTSQTSKQSSGESSQSVDKQAVKTSGNPMVVREVYPEVKGVVVTADGAGDATVKNNLKEAVVSALGVAAYKVCVFEKQK